MNTQPSILLGENDSSRVAHHRRTGRNILEDHGSHADHRSVTHSDPAGQHGPGVDHHTVAHLDVAGQQTTGSDMYIVANHYVVTDHAVLIDKAVITDLTINAATYVIAEKRWPPSGSNTKETRSSIVNELRAFAEKQFHLFFSTRRISDRNDKQVVRLWLKMLRIP